MTGELLGEHVVVIPHDGNEHACVCGFTGYFYVTDNWGYCPPSVAGDEGQWVGECPHCERELIAGPDA